MALARRHAYLQALGLDPLVLRVSPENGIVACSEGAAASESRGPGLQNLHLGPGDGSILLVCNSPAEAATRLATDIARSLDSEPVWSWPMPAQTGQGLTLQQIIEQRLFTRVLIFGNKAATRAPRLASDPDNELAGEPASKCAADVDANVIASARIIRTLSIGELEKSAGAKRALWSELCLNHWCAVRARKA
jgi:DNA polymerase III psi subunit